MVRKLGYTWKYSNKLTIHDEKIQRDYPMNNCIMDWFIHILWLLLICLHLSYLLSKIYD